MKTIEVVTLPKGYYVTKRIGGRAIDRQYFKTKTAANDFVKTLKKEGYALA